MDNLMLNGGVFDDLRFLDDEDDYDDVLGLIRRPYYLPVRANINYWDDFDFFQRFRLTKRTFLMVLQLVTPALHNPNTRSRYLTPEQKLLITLRFMASGSMQLVVADVIRVSASTVCKVLPVVCMALIAHLNTFIKMPTTQQERETAAAQFFAFAGFPRTIGAIDCTHIKLQSPGGQLSHKIKLRCKSLHRRKKDERLLLDLPTTDPGSDLVFSTDDEYIIDSNGIQCYGTMPRNIRRGLLQSELQRRYIEEIGDGVRHMPPELIITSPSNRTKRPPIKILFKPAAKKAIPPKSAELPIIGGPARRTSSWHNLNTISQQSPVAPQWHTVNMPRHQSPIPSSKPVLKTKSIAKKEPLTKEDLDIKLSLKKKIWTGIQPEDAPYGVDRSRALLVAPPVTLKTPTKKIRDHNAGPSCSGHTRRLENEAFLTACTQKLLEWQVMNSNDDDVTPRNQKTKLPVALMMPEINEDRTMRIFKHLANIKKPQKPKTDNDDNKSKQKRNVITKVTETSTFITKITKTKSRSNLATSYRTTINKAVGVNGAGSQHKLQGRSSNKFKTGGIVATAVQPSTNAKYKSKKHKSSSQKLQESLGPLKINGTGGGTGGSGDARPLTGTGIVIAATATTIARKVKTKLKKKKSPTNLQNTNNPNTLTTIYSAAAIAGSSSS